MSDFSNEKLRTFVAIPLGVETLRDLRHVQDTVRTACDDRWKVSWTASEVMHLTMRFLGDVAADVIPSVTASLQAIGQCRSFELALDGLGCFPEHGLPRVIWIGVRSKADHLTRLADAIQRAPETAGIQPEERSFHPHVTLGRVKACPSGSRASLSRLTISSIAPTSVSEVVLYRSFLGPRARHEPIAHFQLDSSALAV